MNVWKILTLNCNEASLLVSEGRDRELTKLERYALRAHLVGCANCKRFRRQVDRIGTEVQSEESLSSEARARILKEVERQAPPKD